MAHENEYGDAMVAMCELVWGEGFMAPGGEGNVAKMVEGIDLEGRRVLDIGCGLGAPASVPFYSQDAAEKFAEQYGGEIVGLSEIPENAILGPVEVGNEHLYMEHGG